MPDRNEVIAEIELQREEEQRLTEREEVELQRQTRLLDVQLEFVATMQADLDALAALLRSAAPVPQPEHPTNGNDHDRAYQPEMASSNDRM